MDAHAEEPQQRKSLKATVKNMIRETKLHIVHVGYKVNSVRDVDARHSPWDSCCKTTLTESKPEDAAARR